MCGDRTGAPAPVMTHRYPSKITMQHANRESWLNYVASRMAPVFAELGKPLPKNVRIAIGWMSSGTRSRAIGECWDRRCSEDSHFEIFIKPTIGRDKVLMPLDIAAVLAHELVHAAVGIPEGHGKEFRRVAIGIGLTGKMTATVPGAGFEARMRDILRDAGALPHARMKITMTEEGYGEEGEEGTISTAPKKQVNRHVKCECETCGYTVRTTNKWIEIGAPHCPQHGAMRVMDAANSEDD
jgi:hypothetical protein